MLHYTSIEVGSLRNLYQKFNSYLERFSNDAPKREENIVFEYLHIDDQIEGLWVEITATKHPFLLKPTINQPSGSFLLHLIYSNQYQNSSPISPIVKQDILAVSAQEPYQVSLLLPYQGESLLLNLSEQWCRDNLPREVQTGVFQPQWNPIYSHCFYEINKLKSKNTATEKMARKSLLSQLIFQVVIDLIQSAAQENANIGLNAAKKYLTSNLHLPFPSLKFLADISCMSVSQFKNKFQQSEHLSPGQFFINKRMEAALNYLQRGFSVKETALSLGYSNSSNFINTFKSKYGKSPLQYSRASTF